MTNVISTNLERKRKKKKEKEINKEKITAKNINTNIGINTVKTIHKLSERKFSPYQPLPSFNRA